MYGLYNNLNSFGRFRLRHGMYTLPKNLASTIYSGNSKILRIVDLIIQSTLSCNPRIRSNLSTVYERTYWYYRMKVFILHALISTARHARISVTFQWHDSRLYWPQYGKSSGFLYRFPRSKNIGRSVPPDIRNINEFWKNLGLYQVICSRGNLAPNLSMKSYF